MHSQDYYDLVVVPFSDHAPLVCLRCCYRRLRPVLPTHRHFYPYYSNTCRLRDRQRGHQAPTPSHQYPLSTRSSHPYCCRTLPRFRLLPAQLLLHLFWPYANRLSVPYSLVGPHLAESSELSIVLLTQIHSHIVPQYPCFKGKIMSALDLLHYFGPDDKLQNDCREKNPK
jgi:hypothetical protein